MIETDVRLTADGEVVLFHDARLDRTTNGEGAVNEWSWPDLQRLDAAYHFRPHRVGHYPRRGHGDTIPRLRDVLTEFPTMKFNIDLKVRDPRLVNAVSEIITSTHFKPASAWGANTMKSPSCAKTLPNVALFYPEALMECMAALMAGEDPHQARIVSSIFPCVTKVSTDKPKYVETGQTVWIMGECVDHRR